ncbi:MAG: 23S rRNA pseudouridine1911/1915/1917 synthase [Planctomycetota bacterium]
MKLIETHIVLKGSPKVRMSDISAGTFHTITSRKSFKKAIKTGLVKLNNSKAFTADFVTEGDVITIHKDESVSKKPSIHIPIDILFEDDYLAIINKPAGVEVSGNKKYTIENALPSLLKKSIQKDALERPLPAHRLDYPTSGCLLISKASETLQALHLLFEERNITKKYLAVTIGHQATEGKIDEPIDGKPSLSSFKVLQTIPSKKYDALNLVELTPHTGRRHQLRKHMAHIGHPIFGEKAYGIPENQGRGNGLYLQATFLEFKHPIMQDVISITAPISKKIAALFPEI